MNCPPSSNDDDFFGGLLTGGGGQSISSAASCSSAGCEGGAATAANQNGPAPSKNADEDNFFNQKAPNAGEKKTMDKNSILALYNQGHSSGTAPDANAMHNMFSTAAGGAGAMYSTPQANAARTFQANSAPAAMSMSAAFNPMALVDTKKLITSFLHEIITIDVSDLGKYVF